MSLIYEKYCFRGIRQEEAEQVAAIELACFPPSEACKTEIMMERVALFPELFVVAQERATGKIVGFIDGLATDEEVLRDEFFTDMSLHDPNGKNVMIQGVDVHPDYQRQGIARAMMKHFLYTARVQGRKRVVLTCVDEKISMYKKFGYKDLGESESSWGGEKWHEMDVVFPQHDYEDIHLHSIVSDGKLTPTEVVEEAIAYLRKKEMETGEKKRALIALSDHDTVGGVDEFLNAAKKYPDDLEAVGAIEISADYGTTEVHILAYGIDYQDEEFLRQVEDFRDGRNRRNLKMLEKLQADGFDITMEDLLEGCKGETVARPAFAAALVKKGYASSLKEAFDKYIGNDKPYFVNRVRPAADGVIKLITIHGGIPVLAHLMLCKKLSDEEKEQMVYEMAKGFEYNIKGLETFYSEYTEEEQEFVERLADKYGLFKTCGSDFHGSNKPGLYMFDGRDDLQKKRR